MDIEEDAEIPIILRRPFVLTANYFVDMGKGKLELSVEDQKILFNLFEAMKHSNDQQACCDGEKVEQEIELAATAMILQSPLEKALKNHVECLTKEEEEEMRACIEELDGAGEKSVGHTMFEELKGSRPTEKPKVELKTLPAHLKYVFLEKNKVKPFIISNSLKKAEEDQLVQILKKHKAAIRWNISDLKGISPSYCMHKINMEADYKPVR